MLKKTMTVLALATILLSVPALSVHAKAEDTMVFAAASLTNALGQVADEYEAKTGRKIVLSFAASSTLARQIAASSGADMFVSADTKWMDYLQTRGLIQRATRRNLLGNTLVLIAPKNSQTNITIKPHFALVKALHGGRLAIADPSGVPAGRYAKQALTSLGVWNAVEPHLVPAENVRAALAYVARGEAPLGIVYNTDALIEPKVRVVAHFPENSHTPIVYPAALTKNAKPGARAFETFLSTAQSKAIFEKNGFTVLSSKHTP